MVVFAWLAAATVVVTRGAADEPRVRLSWVRGDEAGGCMDQRGIEAGVIARLGRNPFVGDATLSVEGAVERTGKTWRADIRVRDEHGALAGRRALETEADDCRPLEDAVILAVALVIDPNAATRPLGRVATVPTPIASPPPAPPSAPCPIAEPCPRAPSCPACAKVESPRSHADVLGRFVAAAGFLPRIAFGPELFGAYGPDSLRFTASLWWLPDVSTDDRFAFGLVAGSTGACYGLPIAGEASLAGCAELDLGAIHAVVRDVAELEPLGAGDHPFFGVGAGPRLTVDPGALRLEAGVRAIVRTGAKEFDIRGSPTPIFTGSTLTAVAYVGVGFGAP